MIICKKRRLPLFVVLFALAPSLAAAEDGFVNISLHSATCKHALDTPCSDLGKQSSTRSNTPPSQVGVTFYEGAREQEGSTFSSSADGILNLSLNNIIPPVDKSPQEATEPFQATLANTAQRRKVRTPLPSSALPYHTISPATTPSLSTTREGQEHAVLQQLEEKMMRRMDSMRDTFNGEIKAMKTKQKQTEKQVNSLQKENAIFKRKNSILQAKNKEMQKDLKNTRAKNEDLNKETRRLKEEKRRMQAKSNERIPHTQANLDNSSQASSREVPPPTTSVCDASSNAPQTHSATEYSSRQRIREPVVRVNSPENPTPVDTPLEENVTYYVKITGGSIVVAIFISGAWYFLGPIGGVISGCLGALGVYNIPK